jgi:hypothetical protein
MPEFNLLFFLLGCLGGLLPDILRAIRNRRKMSLPQYFKKATFWLGTLLLVAVGGLTAWILSAETAKDALIYGFASPQILSQIAGSAAPEGTERGESHPEGSETDKDREVKFDLMKWWRS